MKDLILKWFEKLELPEEWKDTVCSEADNFDPAFLDAMDEPYMWLNEQENKMLCLLYALYKTEDFFNTARKRNIPEDILLASLTEVRRYAVEYNKITNGEKIGIKQINWIGKIMCGTIFRLGRLEFEMRHCLRSSEKHGIKEGDPVLAVHIPDNGGPMTEEACSEAYALSKEFFAKYYPEFNYKCYTCSSWLLDKTLKGFLKPDSNIVKFMDSFDIDDKVKESYDALTYLFVRGTTVDDVKNLTPKTSLQKAVVEHIKNGGKLYSGYGFKAR